MLTKVNKAAGNGNKNGACGAAAAAWDRHTWSGFGQHNTVVEIILRLLSLGKPGYKMGSSYADCGLFPVLKSKHNVFLFPYLVLLQNLNLIIYLLAWPFLPCWCQTITDVSIRLKRVLNWVINCCFSAAAHIL